MIDLHKLKEIALKATQGQWRIERDIRNLVYGIYCDITHPANETDEEWIEAERIVETDGCYPPHENDAQFIVASDPGTVLKLIESIEILYNSLKFYEMNGMKQAGEAINKVNEILRK